MRLTFLRPGSVVALLALAGCALLARGPELPVPNEIVFLYTADTGGELKGCG